MTYEDSQLPRSARDQLAQAARFRQWQKVKSDTWRPFTFLVLMAAVARYVLLFAVFGAVQMLLLRRTLGDRFVNDPVNLQFDFGWLGRPVILGLGIAFSLAAYIAFVGRFGFRRLRQSSWRESVAREYYGVSARIRPILMPIDEIPTLDLHELRKTVPWHRRLAHERIGERYSRLRNARRVASLREAVRTTAAAVSAVQATWLLILAGWSQGFIGTSRPAISAEVLPVTLYDTIWHAAAAIPIIELPTTLHWPRPTLFARDRSVTIIFLIMKVMILIPLVSGTVEYFRDRAFDPDKLFTDDLVIDRLVDEFASAGDLRTALGNTVWKLNRDRIPGVPDGRLWTINNTVQHVVERMEGAASG